MIRVILSLVLFMGAIVVYKIFGGKTIKRELSFGRRRSRADDEREEGVEVPNQNRKLAILASLILILFGSFSLLSTSFTIVGADETGHIIKIYGFKPLLPGKIIAVNGERGKQAEILMPGFNFKFLLNVIYDVEKKKDIVVPEGFCGKIVALDGAPLEEGKVYAPMWPEKEKSKMLDATYFLTHGGIKGPQISVVTPGTLKTNQYLFDINPREPVTVIKAGFVGVVKSNQQEVPYVQEEVDAIRNLVPGGLAAPVVPEKYRGIWNKVLYPGKYYLNTSVYEVVERDVKVQTWEYIGGLTRRTIDLKIEEDGQITQTETTQEMPVPPGSADMAVITRVEGWVIYQDIRVVVQVTPENAPYVEASVGGIQEVENRIMTPIIRSVYRNVTGDPNVKVLDLIEKREELEAATEKAITPEGAKAYVTIKEVRFGDPVIPPELLVARLREQLASQLKKTFEQEKLAQDTRITTEKARAEANQQDKLMEAQIKDQAAEFLKTAMQKEGEGEKLRLLAVAEGQRAQTEVLGQDRVMLLSMLKEILQIAKDNPDIIKVPLINVSSGTDAGLEGAAAILGGSSNIAELLSSYYRQKQMQQSGNVGEDNVKEESQKIPVQNK